MKKIIHKIIYICLLTFAIIMLKDVKVQAASASLTATTIEPTEGQSVTVTANVTAGAWNLQFAGNGKNETIYGYTQSNANATDSKTITFTAGPAGTTYKFTLTGDMTDISADNSESVNKSISITVKAPVVTTPQPEPEPEVPATNNNTQPETPQPAKKSSEARLSNLGINPKEYDFSGFSKNTSKESWNAEVPNNVEEVEVYATAKDKKAKVEGTGKVELKEGANAVKVKVTAEDGTTIKTYTINIKRRTAEEEATENAEAGLKMLGIKPEEYDFTGFEKDKTEYSVLVPNETEQIEVYATAINSKAQITGIGMIDLVEGENELPIEVIAVDGTKKTYTIKVTREKAEEIDNIEETTDELGLSTLTITGLTINPKFDTEVYEYKIDLSEDLNSLDIKTKANNSEATIEIVGNENLQQGENIITILLKNEETEEVATYQIIVNKNVVIEERMSWLEPETWGKEEKIKIAIGGILIVLIIIAIILKIKISRDGDEAELKELPGADDLDKAITEHQELSEGLYNEENLSEEISVTNSVNDETVEYSNINMNYIEEIAKNKFEYNEDIDSNFGEEDTKKSKRKGRHF